MVSDMHQVARSDYMDLQIWIGQEVTKIYKSPHDVALVWDQAWSLRSLESRPLLHLAQQSMNRL